MHGLHLLAAAAEQRDDARTAHPGAHAAEQAGVAAREHETQNHSQRVQAYTTALARRVGVPESDLGDITRGALLHDIGKIGISDTILLKPAKLTADEWHEMRRHPEIGYRILRGIPYFEGATRIVRYHHERWDGSGYPHGLAGDEIPLEARIFAVVDTFDAMTSDRVYRRARPAATAFAELRRFAGTQFDPAVVDSFITHADAITAEVQAGTAAWAATATAAAAAHGTSPSGRC